MRQTWLLIRYNSLASVKNILQSSRTVTGITKFGSVEMQVLCTAAQGSRAASVMTQECMKSRHTWQERTYRLSTAVKALSHTVEDEVEKLFPCPQQSH